MHAPVRSLGILAVALMLTMPVAAAGWKMFGSFEPDTPQDVAGGFMHLDPDTSPDVSTRQVYFNAELGYDQHGLNPNVGALETRLLIEGFQLPHAWLGIWKDCNKDGYVGLGAGALMEYADVLLSDTTVCPPGQSDHNANGWVYEFLPIGPKINSLGEGTHTPRLIDDEGAYVWGDADLPGTERPGSCFVNPPPGTFGTSGALIGWADCLTGRRGHEAVATVDPDGDLGLKWQDPAAPHCDGSILTSVQLGLWRDPAQCRDDDPGVFEENTGRPAFSAFDCDADPAVVVHDDTGLTRQRVADPSGGGLSLVFDDDGHASVNLSDEKHDVYTLPAVNPAVDPDGSVYDATNATDKATLGACDDRTVVTHVSPESDDAGNQLDVQRDATFSLQLYDVYPRAFLFGFDEILLGDDASDVPPYGGIAIVRGSGLLMPVWTSNILQTNSVLLRGDLQPASAAFYTFYARVSTPVALNGLAASTVGIYGSEWCTNTSGVVHGFDCDANNWYDTTKGANAMPTEAWSGRPIGQRPGDAYHLRDIDCYDGTIAGPLRAGLTDLSEQGSCPAVPQ